MKIKEILKATIALALVCLMAFSLAACSDSLTVTINDAGKKTEIEAKIGSKIYEVLNEAGISILGQDKTEPPLDSELTDDVTEITVKRYAEVKVYKGDEIKTAVLVGGRVEDAIKEAGFTLEDGEQTDAELSSYLKNGMEIHVTKETKVTLTADGKTREITTNALNVKKLLEEQKITLGEYDEVSEKTEAALKNGMKITVKRIEYKEETETKSIDYTSEKQYSGSINEGEYEVTQSGSKGEKELTYKVKYVDGKKDSREKVSEKVTKKPVNEIITYGTKSNDPNASGYSLVGINGAYALKTNTENENLAEATVTVTSGTYELKICDEADSMYGNGNSCTDSTPNAVQFGKGWDAYSFTATGGTYTFTYNTSNNMLTIAKIQQ